MNLDLGLPESEEMLKKTAFDFVRCRWVGEKGSRGVGRDLKAKV